MSMTIDKSKLEAIRAKLPELRDRRHSENSVQTVDVTRQFQLGENVIHALRGVDLTVKRGEYTSLMGPSGTGKTTLFNMIGGLDKPTAGKVFIDGVDIAQLDPFELAWLRCRKIGYIFQNFRLIPVMTALENVTLPMIFAGAKADEARDRGVDILTKVGLGDRLKHKPGRMSGGQQQRVAVARALANSPVIVLADEPTGNLDTKTGEEIIEQLSVLCRERGVTVIAATHDHKMLSVSDRVISLLDGRIEKVRMREDIDIKVGSIR